MAVNVFELFAKIGLDTKEYEENLGKSESKFKSFGKALGNGLKTAAKVGTAAIGTASAGIVALTKQAVESYAEYEQLVGGVETLFRGTQKSYAELSSEMSAQGKTLDEINAKWKEYNEGVYTVTQNAENAYKTAGMSANEYMETVTSFSASLIQSLGGDTAKAAEYANTAITDMSDNANKMGTDISMIQNAYQGFAKQNYTMLDNLKLGYGGTKEEMARLIEDAAKLKGLVGADAALYANKGVNGDLSIIIDSIHTVQTELGITGTTAREASETIAGSTAMMKASWQNLLTGIADEEADFETLISNFVGSVGTVAENILPRVEVALGGVGDLIANLLPIAVEGIGNMLETVVPSLIETAGEVINVLAVAFSDNAPYLIQSALDLLLVLGEGLLQNAPLLVDTVLSMIAELANWLFEYSYVFGEGAIDLIVALANMLVQNLPELIPSIIGMITEIVRVLTDPENLAVLLDAALSIILAIGESLVNSLPSLVTSLLDIIGYLVSFFTDDEQRQKIADTAWELGKRLVEGLWEGVKAMAGWLKDKLFGWFDNLIGDVKEDQEIHSPSRKWARVLGKPMGQGVGVGAVAGLEEAEKLIQGEMDNMTASVTADVNSSYSGAMKTPADQTNELLITLINLFESGKAKTNISNARDLRSVSYG